MSQEIANCVVRGVGHFVPDQVVTNHDLTKLMDTTDEWITERTGIKERRFTRDGVTTSQLATQAAERALAASGFKPGDVDMIIAATLSPDYYFPGIGVLVQKHLGMPHVPALDIRAQCSGLVYGLSTAQAFIRSRQAKKILLVCAEIQHPVLDLTTRGRDMAVLFGDGAGALVLESVADSAAASVANGKRGIIDSHLGGDGSGAEVLTMRLPGSCREGFIQPEDLENKGIQPRMDGKLVFKNAVTRMIETATIIMKRNGISSQDIKMLFPHQANLRINEMVREHLGLPPERVFNNIQKYGNTTAATIPIAMSEAVTEGRIQAGDLVMTLAFGAGFTWGANLLRW